MLHSFSNGSVYALYSARHVICKAFFLKFSDPVKLVPPRVWYKIGSGCFSSECGSTCLRRFITPTARDTLFDIFLVWEFKLIFVLIVSPRKLNSSTLSLPISFIFMLGISQSRNVFCLTCNKIYLVLEKLSTANQSITFLHFVVNLLWYWLCYVPAVEREWDRGTRESSVVCICYKCKLFGNGMHIIDV